MKLSAEDHEMAAILAIQQHLTRIGANTSKQAALDELAIVMGAAAMGIWALSGKQFALAGIDVVRAKVTEIPETPEGMPGPGLRPTPPH